MFWKFKFGMVQIQVGVQSHLNTGSKKWDYKCNRLDVGTGPLACLSLSSAICWLIWNGCSRSVYVFEANTFPFRDSPLHTHLFIWFSSWGSYSLLLIVWNTGETGDINTMGIRKPCICPIFEWDPKSGPFCIWPFENRKYQQHQLSVFAQFPPFSLL